MSAPAEKPLDQTRIVALLAKESQQSVADVATLYEHERDELASGAHITKFLHIFAIRNVQEILRKRVADNLGALAGFRRIVSASRASDESSTDGPPKPRFCDQCPTRDGCPFFLKMLPRYDPCWSDMPA
jgi:hypothetical protein